MPETLIRISTQRTGYCLFIFIVDQQIGRFLFLEDLNCVICFLTKIIKMPMFYKKHENRFSTAQRSKYNKGIILFLRRNLRNYIYTYINLEPEYIVLRIYILISI